MYEIFDSFLLKIEAVVVINLADKYRSNEQLNLARWKIDSCLSLSWQNRNKLQTHCGSKDSKQRQ